LQENIKRKAYEIAYALGRIGASVGGSLGDPLTGKGIEILDAVINEDKNKAERLISAVDYFIKLGAGLGSIGQGNADLLAGQGNILKNLMVSTPEKSMEDISSKKEDIDLSDIFSDGFGNDFSKTITDQQPEVKKKEEIPTFLKSLRGSNDDEDEANSFAGHPAKQYFVEEKPEENNDNDIEEEIAKRADAESGNEAFSPLSGSIRQSSILNIIRQSGNCRMKDLQEKMSRYSERTIRYDLESLIQKKLIERTGAGSSTAYHATLKETAST